MCRGSRPPSKTFSARRAIHVRHDDGAAQQSASVVLPLRLTCLRALWRTQPSHNERGGRVAYTMHILQSTHAPTIRRTAVVQFRRRMPTCSGTGTVRTVDRASLVPDETKSIDAGAVLPWGSLMWDLMKQVCGAMGVRTNIPFNQLTDAERDIVFNGPAVKKHILYKPKKGNDFAELDFTYFNAVYTVENALAKAKDEKGIKRVSRFLSEQPCPDCSGTRLSQQARQPQILGINLAQATAMTLDETIRWVRSVPKSLPQEMRAMATAICESFEDTAERLVELGLCYLSLDRAGATLSTGERQRVQLARSVRNRTTGVLYVLDEPSIGLHPANVDGLLGVMRDLVADGNSVVVVDHDTRVLAAMDHLVEMGPTAGAEGGHVIAQGAVADVMTAPGSQIAPFLRDGGKIHERARPQIDLDAMFAKGRIHLETNTVHTVHPLLVDIPRGRLTVVSGVSGSGKTTMVLETLVLRCARPLMVPFPRARFV